MFVTYAESEDDGAPRLEYVGYALTEPYVERATGATLGLAVQWEERGVGERRTDCITDDDDWRWAEPNGASDVQQACAAFAAEGQRVQQERTAVRDDARARREQVRQERAARWAATQARWAEGRAERCRSRRAKLEAAALKCAGLFDPHAMQYPAQGLHGIVHLHRRPSRVRAEPRPPTWAQLYVTVPPGDDRAAVQGHVYMEARATQRAARTFIAGEGGALPGCRRTTFWLDAHAFKTASAAGEPRLEDYYQEPDEAPARVLGRQVRDTPRQSARPLRRRRTP